MSKLSRRRGRNRANVEREPNGRAKRTYGRDDGTPETKAKRMGLAERYDGRHGDPAKTTTPLDALETNGTITADQHKAGEAFGRMYRAVFGRADGSKPFGDHPSNDTMAKVEARLRRRMAAILGGGRRQRDTVVNICAYGRWTRWIPTGNRNREGDIRDLALSETGLNRLIEVGQDEGRRAAEAKAKRAAEKAAAEKAA